MIATMRRRAAGKVLPYDAEVEYLESTGTQWIDTGINLREVVTVSATVSISKHVTANSALFGAFFDNANAPKLQVYVNGQNRWGNVNSTYYTYDGVPTGQNITLNSDYTISATTKAPQASDATIYIFMRNNNTGSNLPFDGLRLHDFVAMRNDITLRRYIPVRVGQVGYMYDKVSGQLFGNQGTGAFVVGPDVVGQ